MAETHEQLEVTEELINREFSEEGLAEIIRIGTERYNRAMNLYDGASGMSRWKTDSINRATDTANRLVQEVVIIGFILDKVVPLSADLHWFDAIQAEAEAELSAELQTNTEL